MVVPFGVSVGDFIAVLGLIREVAVALADTHGSASKLKALIERLDGLKAALGELELLEWEDEAFAAKLKDATGKLNDSIKGFHSRIATYRPALEIGGGSKKWKKALKKIQFTFIKDDIARLEMELLVHIGNVKLLIEAAKLKAFRNMKARMIAAEAKLEEIRSHQITFSNTFGQCAVEIRALLVAILNVVVSTHGRISFALPRQICFDQPLTLQDALGKFFPIHREWIHCWEAFFDVLQIHFQNRPGFQAVRTRNYKLQDGSTDGKWLQIDFERPYEEVFQSGGRWDQLMAFPFDPSPEAGCPRCGFPEQNNVDLSRIRCLNCGLCYSRASDAWAEVLVFPDHFVMPVIATNILDPVKVDPDDSGVDYADSAQRMSGEGSSHQDRDEQTDPVGASSDAELRLEDFANVFFTLSPPVQVLLPDGKWYTLPWQVFQSAKRTKHLVAGQLQLISRQKQMRFRDWNFGHIITEENWESRVYFGMVAEMVLSEERGAVDASGTDALGQELACQLCRKSFFSRAALGRHTTSHLRASPCPVACSICNVD